MTVMRDGVADATGVDDSTWSLTLTRGQPTKGGAIIAVVSEGVPVPIRSVGGIIQSLKNETARRGATQSGLSNPEIGETGMPLTQHITGKAGGQ